MRKFDSPRLGLRRAVNQLIYGVDHAGNHARTHARSSSSCCSSMHAGSCMPACRSMHAGSCMPVHACRSMHAGSCQLLLMRACARRAYCKKCRVHLGSKRSGRSNIPDLQNSIVGLTYHAHRPRGRLGRSYTACSEGPSGYLVSTVHVPTVNRAALA